MEELVRQMSSKRGFPRDVRAFTAVIRAYGRAGLWKEALELVSTMKVCPCCMCVCIETGPIDRLTDRLIPIRIPKYKPTQARGVKPTVVTYGTAMQALAASGRHVEAFDLLASMKRVRFSCVVVLLSCGRSVRMAYMVWFVLWCR